MKLRLPADLKDKIEAVGKSNGRSMNAQIVFMLTRYFEMEHTETARQRNVDWEDGLAKAKPEDLTLGETIIKEFNEQQTAMLQGLLVKHGVLPPAPSGELMLVQTSRDAMLKPLQMVADVAEGRPRSRTPKIPGQNAPKEGLGGAPKAQKAKKEKPVVTKKRVFLREAEPTGIKLDHTSKKRDE